MVPLHQQLQQHNNKNHQVPLDCQSLATEGDGSVFPNLPSEDEFTANSITKEASAHSLLMQINPRTGAALVPETVQPGQFQRKREFTTPKPLPPKEFTTTTSKPLSSSSQPAPVSPVFIAKPLSTAVKEFTSPKTPVGTTTTTSVGSTKSANENLASSFGSTTKGGGFSEFSADPAFEGFEFPFSSPASSAASKPKKLALSTKDAPDSRRRKAYGVSNHHFGTTNGNTMNDGLSPVKSSKSQQRDPTGFDPFPSDGWATFVEPKKATSPTAAAAATTATTKPVVSVANETKLEELLTQAKSKSRRGNTSINSAPALSASYLRQHHGLGAAAVPRKETTSVTDIISSLEAANASRPSRSSSSRSLSGPPPSGGSRSIRSPSEGARSRRRSVSRQRHTTTSDSEEDNDDGNHHRQQQQQQNKDQENWLFDEVTGALGPRGIAADLESLSGRSNRSQRSKNSARSGKSGKSGRSRRSHSRTHGNDSVGSHRSRYSTKSYISQMSEQSRSVAADLLRLERQLAMVGANERPHRPTTRRSRITVTAPPGKLGIILANKADAKGTVVSGVRTSSALADKIAPGDRIVAIDGEDVSLMTVSEITSIMARKNEYERTLTVLTTPREVRH
jgi:hypothetical protein